MTKNDKQHNFYVPKWVDLTTRKFNIFGDYKEELWPDFF